MELGRAIVVDDLRSVEMRPATPGGVYDRPIQLRLLYEDPASGAEHYVGRYDPGTIARPHRHSAAHTIVVLDGHMQVNGQVIGPGAYAHFPAGEAMHHAPAGDDACLFVIIFHGPFDVEAVEGA
jgi:quercetin dioxygenase-like cupin family protein